MQLTGRKTCPERRKEDMRMDSQSGVGPTSRGGYHRRANLVTKLVWPLAGSYITLRLKYSITYVRMCCSVAVLQCCSAARRRSRRYSIPVACRSSERPGHQNSRGFAPVSRQLYESPDGYIQPLPSKCWPPTISQHHQHCNCQPRAMWPTSDSERSLMQGRSRLRL